MKPRSPIGLLFALALGCVGGEESVAPIDGMSTGRVVQAGTGVGPYPVDCSQYHWEKGLCDLLIAWPFAGTVVPGFVMRTSPVGTSPWQPIEAPVVSQAGRLGAGSFAVGGFVRLDMAMLRVKFRMACQDTYYTYAAPVCTATVAYAFGGGSLVVTLNGVTPNPSYPYGPDDVMPALSVEYVVGATRTDADVYAVYWYASPLNANTPLARRTLRTGPPLPGYRWHAPTSTGTPFGVAYPDWHSP